MASNIPLFNFLQDMKPWVFKIWMTKGARTSKDQFTNDIPFATNHIVGDAALDDLATDVITEVAKIMHPTTRILRVVMGPTPINGGTKGSRVDFHKTVLNDVIGTRGNIADRPCALDICATYNRTGGGGPDGIMKMRGVFADAEISTGAGLHPDVVNTFDKTPLEAFGPAAEKAFNKYNCGMILPVGGKLTFFESMKPVANMHFSGVSQKQLRNHRHSLAAAEKNVFKREIKQLEREAESVFNGLGKEDVNIAAHTILSLLKPLVTTYGQARIAASLIGASEGVAVLRVALPLALAA